MDIDSLVDFNKYTLALAAAGFIYVLEKFVPAAPLFSNALVLVVLGLFLFSSIMGVLVFSTLTSSKGQGELSETGENLIKVFGNAHAFTLIAALLILGYMIFVKVIETPASDPKVDCIVCAQSAST